MAEAAMKMWLLTSVERQKIFDRYYELLKSTVGFNLEITPDDALILLSHHIFVMPKLKEIMGWKEDNHPISVLLKKTVKELKELTLSGYTEA